MKERRCERCNKLLFKEYSGGIQIEAGIAAHHNSRSLDVEIQCPRCRYLNIVSYISVANENMLATA